MIHGSLNARDLVAVHLLGHQIVNHRLGLVGAPLMSVFLPGTAAERCWHLFQPGVGALEAADAERLDESLRDDSLTGGIVREEFLRQFGQRFQGDAWCRAAQKTHGRHEGIVAPFPSGERFCPGECSLRVFLSPGSRDRAGSGPSAGRHHLSVERGGCRGIGL